MEAAEKVDVDQTIADRPAMRRPTAPLPRFGSSEQSHSNEFRATRKSEDGNPSIAAASDLRHIIV